MLALQPWLLIHAFAQEAEPPSLLQSAQEKYQLNLDRIDQQHDQQAGEVRERLHRTLLQAHKEFQAQGDLDAIIKIRTLMEAPAQVDEKLKPEQLPPRLDTLWAQYQQQLLTIKTARLEQQLTLTQSYGQHLDKLVKQLVRAGRVDDAIPYQSETKRVQNLYEEMKATYRQLRPEPTIARPASPQYTGMLPQHLAKHCTLRFTFDRREVPGRATSTPPQRMVAKLSGETHWVADKVRKGVLEFDGEGYLEIPASRIAKIPSEGFSVCLWIKPAISLSDGAESVNFMRQGSWTTKNGYILKYHPSASSVNWLVMEKGRYEGFRAPMPESVLEKGKWHHLAITHADKTVRFFLDGKIKGSLHMPNTYPQPGNHPFILGQSYIGRMDEPMVFDRGLSDKEILQIYEHTLLP